MSINLSEDLHVIGKYSFYETNFIGKGYSSTVYEGINQQTCEKVAIKVIPNKQKKKELHKLLIKSEIEISKKLVNISNILQIYDVYQHKDKTYIISELCQQDLDQLLKKKKTFSEIQAIQYMKQIIKGYQHLWRLGVLHRDLKPANIFIKNNKPKIADFGFAIYKNQVKKFSSYNVGSPLYMSPQTLQYNIYSYKNDIWALGIIFYQLLMGHTPWTSIKSQKDLLKQMKTKSIKNMISKKICYGCINFLIKTIQPNEQLRMNPEQLINYDFLQQQVSTTEFKYYLNINSKNNNSNKSSLNTVNNNNNKLSNICNTLKSMQKSLKLSPNISATNNQQNLKNNKYKLLTHTKQTQSREQSLKKDKDTSFNKNSILSKDKKYTQQYSNSPQKQRDVSGTIERLKKNIKELKMKRKVFETQNPENDNKVKKKSSIDKGKEYSYFPYYPKSAKHLNQHQPKKLYHQHKTFTKQKSSSIEYQKKSPNPQINAQKISNTLLSQIHFCRFSYKLFNKNNNIMTKISTKQYNDMEQLDCHINKQIYGLILLKLIEIKDLSFVKVQNRKQYSQAKQYQRLIAMTKQYQDKYNKSFQNIKPYWQSYNYMQMCIKKKIKMIYYDIKNKQPNDERQKIILLDLLITFIQLIELSKSQNLQKFISKEQMQAITEGKPAQFITKEHFDLLQKKLNHIL